VEPVLADIADGVLVSVLVTNVVEGVVIGTDARYVTRLLSGTWDMNVLHAPVSDYMKRVSASNHLPWSVQQL
jgi:hypothetical protein